MRTWLTTGPAALLLAAAPGQTQTPADPGDTEARTVPFELIDNLVRIPVAVNGQQRSGVLDSGSSVVLVDDAVARELGLKPSEATEQAAGGGNGASKVSPITIPTLKAGPLRFDNLAGYTVDLGNVGKSAGFPIDMLLGAPAFRNGVVRVDYVRRQLTFAPPGTPMDCPTPIPFELVHDVPVIAIELRPTIGQKPVRLKVVVDLGTRHSALMIGGPFLRSEEGRRLAKQGVAKAIGFGVGGQVTGSTVRMAEVRAGQSSFGPLEAGLTSDVPAFETGSFDGTVGVPLWREGVITFDYPGRRLCIIRPGAADHPGGASAAERPGPTPSR